jgi:hypothetical protein
LLERFAELDGAIGDHFLETQAVVLDLLLKMPFVESTLKAGKDGILRKRLDQIVVSAVAHGSYTDVDVVNAGGDEKGHVRVGLANAGEEFETAHARHFEVGNDGIESLALESHEGFLSRGRGRARIIRRAQHHREEFRGGAFVVDSQDADDGGMGRRCHTKVVLGV